MPFNHADLDDMGVRLDEDQIVEFVFAFAPAIWTDRVSDGLRTPMPG